MNLIKWYHDRKVWKLKALLAQKRAELAELSTWEGVNKYGKNLMFDKNMKLRGEIASLSVKLEALK